KLKAKEALPFLLEKLKKDPSSSLKIYLLEAVGAMEDPVAKPILEESLESPVLLENYTASLGLRHLWTVEDFPKLIEFLKKKEPSYYQSQETVLHFLCDHRKEWNPEQIQELFQVLCDHPQPNIRYLLFQILRERDPALAKILMEKEKNDFVKREMAKMSLPPDTKDGAEKE
ncbi:MAG: HEAT repeat domain-containing protein, partial [Planctomycetota bacterium]